MGDDPVHSLVGGRRGARFGRPVLVLVVGTCALAALVMGVRTPAAGAAASPWAQLVTDITGTPLGRSLAEQAMSRSRARVGAVGAAGVAVATDLVVLQDPAGITIGPRGATYAV